MMAQIGDTGRYRGKQYTLVAASAPGLFEPGQYDMAAHPVVKECHRGHWCEYAVEEDALVLKDLYLFNERGEYPPLNGRDILPPEQREGAYLPVSKRLRRSPLDNARMSHHHYKDVDLPIPYTGRLLLGEGLLGEFRVSAGFQPGWAYRELIELVFRGGRLVECRDLSAAARAKRQALRSAPAGRGKPQDIGDSFSLDYAVKARWLSE